MSSECHNYHIFIMSLCQIQITDPAEKRYEVPIDVPVVQKKASNPSYTVDFIKEPFGLIVKRAQTGTVL